MGHGVQVKSALAFFGLMVVGLLVIVSRAKRFDALGTALWSQSKSLVPLLTFAVLIAACVEVLVSPDDVTRWIGNDAGLKGVVVAWVAGAVTPGGGPIGLPLAALLSSRGASFPAVLTYVVSMSLLSLIRLPMEWGILGSRFTLLKWGLTALVPPLLGLVSLAFQRSL